MHCIPIVPRQETELIGEKTATARTIGMPNNEDIRRQPPPGEVRGAELSAESLPLSSVELAKRRAKDKQS